MLDIDMINATIEELENAETTFFNCQNLAHLYIVRDHYKGSQSHDSKDVMNQLNDILPQYKKYIDVKRKYQLKQIQEEAVTDSMQKVCREIKEFIHTLYRNSDTKQEREQIKTMLADFLKEPL